MDIHGNINLRHSAFLDAKRLEELYRLMTNYFGSVSCYVTTLNNSRIVFASIEELINFENHGNYKLKEIHFVSSQKTFEITRVEIKNTSLAPFPLNDSISCNYILYNTNDVASFTENFKQIFRKSKTNHSRIRYLMLLICAFAILILLDSIKLEREQFPIIDFLLFISPIFSIITAFLIDLTIFKYFFPIIIFSLGEEVEIYNKKYELRSRIIWGILVAVAVSILGNIIYSNFFGTN